MLLQVGAQPVEREPGGDPDQVGARIVDLGVVDAGPTDDISELLKELEDTVGKVRTGGMVGSGAKGHREAREKWLELQGK